MKSKQLLRTGQAKAHQILTLCLERKALACVAAAAVRILNQAIKFYFKISHKVDKLEIDFFLWITFIFCQSLVQKSHFSSPLDWQLLRRLLFNLCS